MKKTTIDRIVNNSKLNMTTAIGKYVYDIQYNEMAGKCFIIRCKKDELRKEWIDWDELWRNGWEWLQPID